MKIYTKSGDDGETSLVGGVRVLKSNVNVDIYGDLDELNSFIGVAISFIDKDAFKEFLQELAAVQECIFKMGSLFACNPSDWDKFKLKRISELEVENLEKYIDKLDAINTPLKRFILPGGCQGAAHLHLARAVCRRVERKIVGQLGVDSFIAPENAVKYLNRLSDLIFVMGRYINKAMGSSEVEWS